jgi:hypothetical protein
MELELPWRRTRTILLTLVWAAKAAWAAGAAGAGVAGVVEVAVGVGADAVAR